MIKKIWFILFMLWLFIDSYSITFILAMTVGGYDFIDALQYAFRYISMQSILASKSILLAPYLCIIVLILHLKKSKNIVDYKAIFISIVCMELILIYEFWHIQIALFNGEHYSSTSSISIVFAPMLSMIGIFGGWYLGRFLYNSKAA